MTDTQELGRLFATFGKAYRARIMAEIGEGGTTPARARLLIVLQCRGSCKMSEVGRELGVTPRNVTKLVDGLEGEGLVVREPHPRDRRATLLHLTPRGAAVGKECMAANSAAASQLFERLTPTDRQQLARILRKLLEALHEERKGPTRER
jgi:DNA-binding MarR family transcriptional regulator